MKTYEPNSTSVVSEWLINMIVTFECLDCTWAKV